VGKFLNKILNFPKKVKADYFQETLDRPTDPMLTAIGIKNDSPGVLVFVSTLELNSELEEAPAWKTFRLEAGEKRIAPHHYWTVHPESGNTDCIYSAFAAPRNSDFLYKRRVTSIHNKP